ncbi:hypothetical protein L873DRAFT_796880 [Choiromyces venosus 120613-1]|uniref:Uncharacterized protein n=1 Tax=Choiromyces venosus 120613-1 TaxID=1336337 RepID=A0A3N4K4M1_9PEZI|nr:hypothetical protein L873DRAFT_796880 [Choiromyces venosus 120613-1]
MLKLVRLVAHLSTSMGAIATPFNSVDQLNFVDFGITLLAVGISSNLWNVEQNAVRGFHVRWLAPELSLLTRISTTKSEMA